MSEVVAIVSDCHAPYQDEQAVTAALSLLENVQPDLLLFNGDIADFKPISRFDKSPLEALTLQADLAAAQALMQRFRKALPNAPMIYLWGNHELRLIRYLHKTPELSPLTCLKLENLLELAALDCELWPEGKPYLYRDWVVIHGDMVRAQAGYTAHGMIHRWGANGISGHTHRAALVRKKNYSREFTWLEGGCLCDLQPDYMPVADWQHGLTILEADGDKVWPTLVPILEGECRFGGLTFPTIGA